ncbi:MAG: VPLPA-CTERM sorting domain-containing protein [Aliishimia sp.]
MIKILTFCAATLLPVAGFATTTIDFDGLDNSSSQSLLTQFTEDGFTFDVSSVSDGTSEGVSVFNTLCTGASCNGDEDLVPATQGENGVEGNVLVLQERNSNFSDDDVRGGLFVLTLAAGEDFRFLGASAIDDTTFNFGTRINGVDTFLGSVANDDDSETGKVTFFSDVLTVGDSILVRSLGSGGFDSLLLEEVVLTPPVPLPAGLPLLIGSLAAFGFLRRRAAV